MIDNIRIVLVGTTHAGNIGGAARAMKTMSLRHLRLVEPRAFPSAEASARAAGADDVLANAGVYPDLGQALADCGTVVGTSARLRTLPWPVLEPRTAAAMLVTAAAGGPVAAVFGREHAGLSNRELEHCSHLVHIPTDGEFGSLNLAAAVQVLAYEIKLAARETGAGIELAADSPPATHAERERFYEHLERTLIEIGFLDPANPRHVMRRLRRLFNRAAPEQTEINILRGMLTAVQRRGRGDR